MRGKSLGRFVRRISWVCAAALVLISPPVAIRAFPNEPLPPSEELKHTEQDRCKLLFANAARELRDISEALQGRSWVQRKKLKEITARIEAISEELERPLQDNKLIGN
jgi:hypothetical protein